jgi:ribosome-associated protein
MGANLVGRSHERQSGPLGGRAMICVMPEELPVNRHVAIPLDEVVVRASRSSGPGGQHANVTSSRIEASFDVEASATLDDAQKRRIVARHGPVVRAIAQDARSQSRNRALALQRLAGRIAGALEVQRPRRPTKATKASRQRRLEAKRRGAERKRDRRRPAGED